MDQDLGSLLDQAIELIERHGVKVVAFDMDFTAVAAHSRGSLRRSCLDEYALKSTKSFREIVPRLHHLGIGVAIATHSDEAEFSAARGVVPESHILGNELAVQVLKANFPPKIVETVKVVAYQPNVRPEAAHDESFLYKRFHMRELCEHFKVKPGEILFFDDLRHIVDDCKRYCNVHAIQVDETRGFHLEDLINGLNM